MTAFDQSICTHLVQECFASGPPRASKRFIAPLQRPVNHVAANSMTLAILRLHLRFI